MNQPNPAKQARNRIIAALQGQQRMIATLQEDNVELRRAVATLVVAAGVGENPHFASLVRRAGLNPRLADVDTNEGDSVGETPATSTEEAKKPDATDNVESPGAAPSSVNSDVTPAGTTDVQNTDVVANPPVLDNLQDTTAPVSGTDAVVPAAGDAGGASQVSVGQPSNQSFDPPGSGGWKGSSKGDPQERFVASMRLARLRIEAEIEQGEDLAIAQQISDSEAPLGEINAQVTALQAVATKQGSTQVTAERTRGLVPRRAQQSRGIAPVGAPSLQSTASAAGREGEDSFLVGMDDLG